MNTSRKYILNSENNEDSIIHPYYELENMIIDYLDVFVDYRNLILVNKYYHDLITNIPIYRDFIQLSEKENPINLIEEYFTRRAFPGIKSIHVHHIYLYLACKWGYLSIVRYLLVKYGFSSKINLWLTIGASIRNDYVDITKFLYYFFINREDINTCNLHNILFTSSCDSYHLEIAKFTYLESLKIKNPISINSTVIERMLRKFCDIDNYELINWFLDLDSKIDITSCLESVFMDCCRKRNKFKNIRSLYYLSFDRKNKINIRMDNDKPFRLSCACGNLENAQFLYQLSLDNNDVINIHANNDEAFRQCCKNKHAETAKWLCTLCDKYILSIIPEGFVHCTI